MWTRRTSTAPSPPVEKAQGHKPETFHDFRKLLERKELDAVMVGTPDHWHALPFIHACRAGKDVFVEKPLSYSIGEGRAMVDAALKNQPHSARWATTSTTTCRPTGASSR